MKISENSIGGATVDIHGGFVQYGCVKAATLDSGSWPRLEPSPTISLEDSRLIVKPTLSVATAKEDQACSLTVDNAGVAVELSAQAHFANCGLARRGCGYLSLVHHDHHLLFII